MDAETVEGFKVWGQVTIERADSREFYAQKMAVLRIQSEGKLQPGDEELLDGLINFLDHIGDQAEAAGYFQYPKVSETMFSALSKTAQNQIRAALTFGKGQPYADDILQGRSPVWVPSHDFDFAFEEDIVANYQAEEPKRPFEVTVTASRKKRVMAVDEDEAQAKGPDLPPGWEADTTEVEPEPASEGP